MTRRAQLDAVERFTVQAALGRIFSIMQRPSRPGDVAEFERCRAAILDVLDPVALLPFGEVVELDARPSWIRDRRGGAAGDQG